MSARIIINGKEVTNPFVKSSLIIGALIAAAIVIALVIFVLLPIIGIAVTLSIGFIVIFIIATVVGAATLVLLTIISAWLFGSAEFRIEKKHPKYDD